MTPAALRSRAKCKSPRVAVAFDDLVKRLGENPFRGTLDRRAVWGKAWPDVPNHQHANLPDGWRATWTVRHLGAKRVVTILFLGTHKEYEELYGFAKQ